MKDAPQESPILARGVPVGLPESAAPEEIMWMPAGLQEFSAAQNGKPVVGRVFVDRDAAALVQEAFSEFVAKSQQRPYFDFDHDDEAASAWPKEFVWRDGADGRKPGIYVRVEWSKPGAEAIAGKAYRSFSPGFFATPGDPRRIIGARVPNMGGLVNNPGFKGMAPIWAKDPSQAAQPPINQNRNNMEPNTTPGASAPAAAAPDNANAIQAKDAQIASLKAENQALQAKETARRKAEADTAVKTAVARGALPPKDEAIQAKWRGLIEADPQNAELLAAMPSSPAFSRVTQPGGLVAVRDGLLDCLRTMKDAKDVDVRAAIYAKDVSPLFDKSDFRLGPILAANALGTLAGELVSQRSLTLLKREFPSLFAISTDFSDEGASFGQTVNARLRTIPSVTDYNADTGYATSDATAVDVPVVINGHKAVQIAFGANELGSTKRDLFGEQAEGAHNAIGADLLDALLALAVVANFNAAHTSTIALADFDRSKLSALGAKLTKRKVRKQGRFAMLNADYHDKLGQDSSIVTMAAYGQREIITEGMLPRIARFQPYEVAEMPTTGNLVGFAGTPDALAVATRVPADYTQAMPDVPSNGVVQIVKNPDTQISVMLVRFIDHNLGKAFWRLAYMRGVAVGQADSGERIISAAP